MKFYAEILHPQNGEVLWHYFLEAPDKDTASNAIGKQVIAEHSNGFLLDTGGLFIQIVEEDKEGEDKLSVERIASMTDDEVYELSSTPPNQSEERGFRLSNRRFESKEEMAKCMKILVERLERIMSASKLGA